MQTSLIICVCSLLSLQNKASVLLLPVLWESRRQSQISRWKKRNKGREMAGLLQLASHSGCHWSQLFQRISLLMKVGAHGRGGGSGSALLCLFCPSFKIVFSALFQVSTCLFSAEPLRWFGGERCRQMLQVPYYWTFPRLFLARACLWCHKGKWQKALIGALASQSIY